MIWLAIVLAVIWVVCWLVLKVTAVAIHLLLLFAVASLIVHFFKGRNSSA